MLPSVLAGPRRPGCVSRRMGAKQTNYSFTNVLGQIGLGYVFVFMVLGRRPAVQLAVAVLILFAYWLLFVRYPLPRPRLRLRAL